MSKNLGASAVKILEYLSKEGKKTQRELIHELGLPTRTVRYSLLSLKKRGLTRQFLNVRNINSPHFGIKVLPEEVERILEEEKAYV